MNKRQNTAALVLTGMFAAVISIMSQLSIPLPTGVPITLQTFAVALAGYVLGAKLGTGSVLVWLFIGTIGMPVFANMRSGPEMILGYTGGFLIAFPIMAFSCGLGNRAHKILGILPGLGGLVVLHISGELNYMRVAHVSLPMAFTAVTLPYIAKDICSVALAWIIGKEISKRLGLSLARIQQHSSRH